MAVEKREKKRILNQLRCECAAVSENERLSRAMVCAMVAQIGDIAVDDLADVRCAVSEAVTNAVVHAYKGTSPDRKNTVYIFVTLYSDRSVRIVIRDRGCGIRDIHAAMEPLYTTDESGERSGMGFAIMQSFMDTVRVRSAPGAGTTVELRKRFAVAKEQTGPVPVQGGTEAPESNDGTPKRGQEDIA